MSTVFKGKYIFCERRVGDVSVVSHIIHSGPGIRNGAVSRELFHVTDWLPTLVAAAGTAPGNIINPF